MGVLWRIEMLGRLRAVRESPGPGSAAGSEIARFQTRRTGLLLAFLAYYLDRPHPRGELIDRLWPESSPDAGRNKLRIALTSLRHQLEPPDVPSGLVIVSDRTSVQLNPRAVSTDVASFEASLNAAAWNDNNSEPLHHLLESAETYQGELLPGHLEEWILTERQRLAELFYQALRQLIASLEENGDRAGAIRWAGRAIATDPLREEAHYDLICLLAEEGQHVAALQYFRDLERRLDRELGLAPSRATAVLAGEIAAALRENTAPLVPRIRPVVAPEAEATRPVLSGFPSSRSNLPPVTASERLVPTGL
jgi:DNA-binding SARP family transcriptional activator